MSPHPGGQHGWAVAFFHDSAASEQGLAVANRSTQLRAFFPGSVTGSDHHVKGLP